MTPEQVRAVLRLSAGAVVSARQFTPGQLTEFAGIAAQTGAALTVRHAASLTPDARAALAAAAGRSLTFDFTE